MIRRSTFILALVLLAALTLTGCSRGARAGETVDTARESAADAAVNTETNDAAAHSAPAMAMAPHVVPDAVAETAVTAIVGADAIAETYTETGHKAASAQIAQLAPDIEVRTLPDRLVMTKLAMDIPVEEIGWSMRPASDGSVYSQWDEASFAAGWHKNSAIPGEGGNVVLSGHNNIMGAVFRELDQLSRGDIATLYVDGEAHEYAVERVLIVPETSATIEQRKANAAYIQPTEDEQLTLVSCWPRDNNTHRIIVIATPVGE